MNRLQEMYGDDFDPILRAAENAVRMQAIADENKDIPNDATTELALSIRGEEFNQRKECVNAWDKIAQYVTPKLKAVEITGEDGEPVRVAQTIQFIGVNASTD